MDANFADAKQSLLNIIKEIAKKTERDRMQPLTINRSEHLTDLVSFSIISTVSMDERNILIAAAASDLGACRAAGALVGLAVGDGLGAHLEFSPAVDVPLALGPRFDVTSFGYIGLERTPEMTRAKELNFGQWTDDTAMALCMTDSLLKGYYDGSDIRVRFWNWWNQGYNNAFKNDSLRKSCRSVGLGMTVGKSLDAIKSDKPPSRYFNPSEDAGNGSLMRLAPVPIAFSKNLELAMLLSAESSYTTHPGRIAAAACRFLGFLIWSALNSHTEQMMKQFMDSKVGEYLNHHMHEDDTELRRLLEASEPQGSLELCWNWKSEPGG